MPFELRNTAQTFQRLIDEVFRGLLFAFAYIDVLIACRDIKELQDHMQQVFERRAHFGLKINVNKCGFAVSKQDFFSPCDRRRENHTVSRESSCNTKFRTTNITATSSEISRFDKLLL